MSKSGGTSRTSASSSSGGATKEPTLSKNGKRVGRPPMSAEEKAAKTQARKEKAATARREKQAAAKASSAPAVAKKSNTSAPPTLATLRAQDIHPTKATKFGSQFRNTYHVKLGGAEFFVKRVREDGTFDGQRYMPAAQTRLADDAARLLGMENFVTPTRIIERGSTPYAVMPWVKGKDMGELSPEKLRAAVQSRPAQELQRDALFNYLIADSDHSTSGYMLRSDGSIRGVDYEGSFDPSVRGVSGNANLLAHATGDDFVRVALDRGIARSMLAKTGALRELAVRHGMTESQLAAYDARVSLLRSALTERHPAYYDLINPEYRQYERGFDRSRLITVGQTSRSGPSPLRAATATTTRKKKAVG